MNYRTRLAWIAAVVAIATFANGGDKASGRSSTAATSENGKIPITTKSEDAKNEFLQGRDLFERLLAQDSLQHFDKALALDPDFASAELARANASPTIKEFLEHLNKAVSLADKASDGEKLMILANEAGSNGEVNKQKADLNNLVAAFPNDERAQFALGGYYFGQQEWAHAIEHNKKAIEIAPNYSPAYNILGYSYRQAGDYADAEQAFKKYIDLIPNDPNPYDSYAELLLKIGRFDESVAQYRKALSIDPKFNPSRFGLSADLTYMGKPDQAQTELQNMANLARNDGELRTALFGMAVLASDGGKFDQALQVMDKEYAVAEKKNDVMSMAGDLQAKGNIAAQMQDYDVAQQQFDRSFRIVQDSNLSQEIKDNSRRLHEFNLSAIALNKKDYSVAKAHCEEFRRGAQAGNNPLQLKQWHELAGRIALAEKDYDKAIAELIQANEQNPRNLYRLGEAYQGKGETAKAQEFFSQAANFNPLPQLNYAFIRAKAQRMVAGKKPTT
ncbi:MAG TPA: tetratricopeptide repeat protein [Terriglobales bacterium]|nr:tetratricopeptide repeat protein [Terriglobales bacterium]